MADDTDLLPVLRGIMSAWSDGDIEGVLAHLHDDIVWHAAAGAFPPVRGKAQARALLEHLQTDMHDVRWSVFASATAGNRLFVEGVDAYRTSDGHEVATPYAGVLDIVDGLVIGWRDYVDMGTSARQRAGEAFSAHVQELLDRPAL